MRPTIRDMWADALESGDYDQCKGALTIETDGKKAHCCLGVLTELAAEAGVTQRAESPGSLTGLIAYSDGTSLGATALPPRAVMDWAGLDESNPHVDYAGSRFALAHLNDELGLSFAEIAQLVRTQL